MRVPLKGAGAWRVSHFAIDAAAWFVALFAARLLRVDFDLTNVPWLALLVLATIAAVLQLEVGWAAELYRGRYPYGSFSEVRALLITVLIVDLVIWVGVLWVGNPLGLARSTPLIALPIAFVLMGGARYVKRLLAERSIRQRDDREHSIIFGAGMLGEHLIRVMRLDPRSAYRPVALLDDAPALRFRELGGVRVQGGLAALPDVVRRTRATALVVAIGRADAALLQRVNDAAAESGLRVLLLPPLDELLRGNPRAADLREITISDIVGRHPVDTEIESIAGYLAGKRVAVTGAGGSIGAELCRQIVRFEPREVIMLDRDESALQEAQLSMSGHGLLDTDEVVLVDIRDRQAVEEIFNSRRPEVVFHAAALKHLPMLEQYPEEAWKTNVLGTLTVLRAAMDSGVETFINISTDKAANPTSVLGHSKRLAERLTAWAAEQTGKTFVSVRFGNVLGSRGSMLPVFTAMIDAGGPLTVTHPEVTRYFMTIPEACQLVVQAGGIGEPGEVLLLDMGDPVRILDVAERMIEMSGRDIEIVFTGLRPGEKLHEELVGAGEHDVRRKHPKIAHSTVPALDPSALDKTSWLQHSSVDTARAGAPGVSGR